MSQEKFINKINALYAKAASTEHPAEAEECMRLADRMMLAHQIERSQLKENPGTQEAEGVKVVVWDITFPSNFSEQVRHLLGAIMSHCQIRMRLRSWSVLEVVGFETDIAYAEQVWLSAYREFAGNLFPTWKQSLDFDTNVYNHVKSGYKWHAIFTAADKAGVDVKWPSGRFKAAYHRACLARGEEPTAHTQRHAAFRASYADAFHRTIASRLYEMRKLARQEVVRDEDRYALALRDNKEQVDKEFYRLFPEYDPEVQARRNAEWLAEEEARRAKLTQAERDKEDADNARQRERDAKWWAKQQDKSYDSNGWAHGTKVAKNVDLSGGRGHITPERSELPG